MSLRSKGRRPWGCSRRLSAFEEAFAKARGSGVDTAVATRRNRQMEVPDHCMDYNSTSTAFRIGCDTSALSCCVGEAAPFSDSAAVFRRLK